jgi:hypothetical protein
MKKYLNSILVDMTEEEITKRNDDIVKIKQELTTRTEKQTNEETKKASGKQKLLDLGLTEEEVKALIGA